MIKLEHVSKTFSGGESQVDAVRDVTLEIAQGEIFGIIGYSGAGKSTLVRCINLLERPTEGKVFVDGRELTALSQKELSRERKKIGMIFQQFNLLMQRTCLNNIRFPMDLAGVPAEQSKKRAMELLELVGLPDKAEAYPAQLSGGQKQRVAIARALASDPKVLLCDEATSALDPQATRSVLKLIQDINKETGITVVVITHEMAVVEEICSRVAILDHGTMVETGTVEEVFSNPKTDAGRRLVYPDGVPAGHVPAGSTVRLAFNGGSVYEPIIASLAADVGVKVSIIAADTRNIDGQSFGTMLLSLPQDPAGAARAMNYLRSQKNLTVEEVRDYHG